MTADEESYAIPENMIFGPDGEPDWDTYYADLMGAVETEPMPLTLTQRYRGMAGAIGAMGLGIQRVIEPHKVKQEIVVQRDDSGDPDNPDKELHLDFDPDDPRQTRAIVRPHNRSPGTGEE